MADEVHSTGSRLAASVPPEILLRIFAESTPPSYEYDPSIIQGPNSSWLLNTLRTKKSLPLVCRAWHAPATELLYSDVVLRRSGQIVALAETLRTTASSDDPKNQDGSAERDLAWLIRRIRIDTLVVLSSHSLAIQKDLAYVLNRSVRLMAFQFHPHPAFPVQDDITEPHPWNCIEAINPAWMCGCRDITLLEGEPEPQNPVADAFRARLRSPTMRELDLMSTDQVHFIWDHSGNIIQLHDTLRFAAENLVSLKLGALRISIFGTLDEYFPSRLVFPALEELWLSIEESSMVEYVLMAWLLPRLAHLTLLACPPSLPEALLGAHGRLLKYLHLYPGRMDDPREHVMQPFETSTLARQCPILRHLVLPAPPAQPLSLQHPSLRYLDVWSATIPGLPLDSKRTPEENVRASFLHEEKCSLPALRGVRVLLAPGRFPGASEYHLPAGRHPSWPIVCHPAALLSGSTAERDAMRYHVFSSAWAMQLEWGVISLMHPYFQTWDNPLKLGDGEDAAISGVELVDLPDEMRPTPEMLRVVLEEQSLEYSDAAADADYVLPEDQSESESESDLEPWDPAELAELLQARCGALDERVPQLDRETVLEGFRRGLRAGVVSDSDDDE